MNLMILQYRSQNKYRLFIHYQQSKFFEEQKKNYVLNYLDFDFDEIY